MASGRTHDMAAVVTAVSGGIVDMALHHDPARAAALALGGLFGLYITPDLDLSASVRSEARHLPVAWLRLPFLLLWYPYSLIAHRSFLSHLPLVGTLGRVLYLYGMVWLWLALAEWALSLPAGTLTAPWRMLSRAPAARAWVTGLALVDLVHWLLDGMPVRRRLFGR